MKTRILTRDDGKVSVDVTCGSGETNEAFCLAMGEYRKIMPKDNRPQVLVVIDDDKTDIYPCGCVQVSTR